MEYTQLTLDDWLILKERLKRDLIGVQESFVRIGYTLRKIEEQELYKNDGYKSIAEFAKAEYGLNASTVSRFMSINRKYSIDGYSDSLRPEFAHLGSSKLTEMLALPDGDMEMVRPEATRDAIRELKQFNKEVPDVAVPAADGLQDLVEKFLLDNPDTMTELVSANVFETGDKEQAVEIVNPSGNRVYRKGIYFMMMYENEIKVKKFGGQPETLAWERFLVLAQEVYRSTDYGEAKEAPGTGEIMTAVPGEVLESAASEVETMKNPAAEPEKEQNTMKPAEEAVIKVTPEIVEEAEEATAGPAAGPEEKEIAPAQIEPKRQQPERGKGKEKPADLPERMPHPSVIKLANNLRSELDACKWAEALTTAKELVLHLEIVLKESGCEEEETCS